MTNLLLFINLVLCLIYSALRLNYNIHMLQLNSYRNERYLTFIKRNVSKVIPKAAILPLLVSICTFFILGNIGFIITSLIYLVLILTRSSENQKKKLVYTMRVKRLIFTCTLFYLLVLAILFNLIDWNSNVKGAAVIISLLSLTSVLAFAIILLCNTINLPVQMLINKYYYNDAKKKLAGMPLLTVIGITGSYGKTSTKHVIHKILSRKYNVLMTPESYNTTMGVIITIRNFLKPTHDIFIAEMGAKNPGDIKEICDLVSPKMGILTSVGPQHLESFKTIENVKKTKFELIESLPADGIGFMSMDDENIKTLPKPSCNAVYYGIDSENLDLWAENIKFSPKGSSFEVVTKDGRRASFTTKLLGKHNIYNILSGVAVGLKLDMDLNTIAYAVRDLEPVEHRLQLKKHASGITIIDDAFNSNPVGAKRAIEVLGQMEESSKILITPGMIELGDKEYELNKAFGFQASEVCDFIILVGEKQTKPIQDGLKEAEFDNNKLYIAKNLNDALKKMNSIAKEGSVVLFENDLPDDYNE